MELTAPAFPAGPIPTDPGDIVSNIDRIANAPAQLRAVVSDLNESQLDTRYKNWTLRQIVHHVADSHINAYTRTMLVLTEPTPQIRPYDEGAWAQVEHVRTADIEPSLALLDAVHARWTELFRSLKPGQFAMAYDHPETNERVPLSTMTALYAWHGEHHTAQILWRREAEGWR
ncbi:MAG: YfiT family bacillithiol transferase [Planctomycetota bacterium]